MSSGHLGKHVVTAIPRETPSTPDRAAALVPSFREVFQSFGPYVVRALRHLGVREADVPDACQEVFTVVYRRLPSLEAEAALPSWIYAIAWRVARDHRRRGRRKPEVLAEPSAEAPAAEDVEDVEAIVDRRKQRERLVALLDELDEDRREVFVLYELGELPMSEIATIVGCPLQTAYARLYAARRDVEAIVKREKARGRLG